MIPYMLHASVLISILYLGYSLLLSKETFFQANRFILLIGIAIAFILPTIHIPSSLSLHDEPVLEIVHEEPISYGLSNVDNAVKNSATEAKLGELDIIPSEPFVELKESYGCELEKDPQSAFVIPLWYSGLDPIEMLFKVYLVGMTFFSFMLFLQFLRLGMLFLTGTKKNDGSFQIIENQRNTASFSFLSFIFLNRDAYDGETYEQILEHEKIHVQSNHSFDMFLAELLIIIQWFNPFAWAYKKAIENNLEFITDQKMLNRGVNAQTYQLSLVKVAVPDHNISLTNKYNQSSLKKRIIMMNQRKSSILVSWKYMLIVGFLAMSMACLNSVIANVPEPHQFDFEGISIFESNELEELSKTEIESNIHKHSYSNTELPSQKSTTKINSKSLPVLNIVSLTQVALADTTPSPAQRPSAAPRPVLGLATPAPPPPPAAPRAVLPPAPPSPPSGMIAVRAPRAPRAASMPRPPRAPRAERAPRLPRAPRPPRAPRAGDANHHFSIDMRHWESLDLRTGIWKAKMKDGQLCMEFVKEEENNHWKWSECFDKTEIKNIEKVGNQSIRFEREAGTMVLSGEWQGQKGSGTYKFEPSSSFQSFLNSKGAKDISDATLVQIFMVDYDKGFVNTMVQNNIDLSDANIRLLVVHGIDGNELGGYAKAMKKANLDNSDLETVVQFYIHGIDPDYIAKMNQHVEGELKTQDYISLGIHGVEPEFVAEAKASGMKNLDTDHLVQLYIHGIDHDYIKSFNDLGMSDLDTDELVQFGIHGVDAEYIAEFKKSGLDNLKNEDIVNASIHGVDAHLIKSLHNSGISDLDIDDAIQISIHGLDGAYVKEIKTAIHDISVEDIIRSGIHGMDANYIKEISKLGLEDSSIEGMIEAYIHGIDASDIKEAQKAGHKSKSLGSYVEYIMHTHRN